MAWTVASSWGDALSEKVAEEMVDRQSSIGAALAEASLPLGPAVEGLPLTVYGASYEGADLANSVGARYPVRAARRLGMALTNRGVSGFEMGDMFQHMVQVNSPGRWAAGTKGVVLLAGLMNDVLREPNLPNRKNTFKESLKGCIWRAFCSSIINSNDASIVTSGAWTQYDLATTAGYNMVFKASTAAGATLTIPTGATRDLVVFNYALTTEEVSGGAGTPYAGRGPQFSVAVDGVTEVDTKTPYAGTSTGAPRGWTAVGLPTPILDLPDTTHSVLFTNHQDAGGGTRLQTFDSIGLIDRASLPQVVISKGVRFDPARLPVAGANTAIDLFRTYVDEAVAEIIAAAPWAEDAITVYDPGASEGWDAASMVGSDNVHATDSGQHAMAASLVEALVGLPFRNGMTK